MLVIKLIIFSLLLLYLFILDKTSIRKVVCNTTIFACISLKLLINFKLIIVNIQNKIHFLFFLLLYWHINSTNCTIFSYHSRSCWCWVKRPIRKIAFACSFDRCINNSTNSYCICTYRISCPNWNLY